MASQSNEQLGVAIEHWVASLKDETEGKGAGVLGDWLTVVSMVDINDEGDPVTSYYLAMRGGSMLPHTALGLLHQGILELNSSAESDDA